MIRDEDFDNNSAQEYIDAVDNAREERDRAEEEINRKRQAEKLAEYAEQQKAIDEGTKAAAKNAKESGLDKLTDAAGQAVDTVMGVK